MVPSNFILILVLFTYGCNCHIFNDFLMRDNIALSKLSPYQTKCNSTLPGGVHEVGICKTRTECLLTGGIPRGHCGFLSTCCAYTKSCGRTSNAKVSYFSSGLISNEVREGLCTYNVVVANENVCQIRLDFLQFETTPPSSSTNGLDVFCIVDNFYVTPTSRGMPQICGHNSGQHVYVDVPNHKKNIELNMKIGSNSIPRPYWNIKITQLECPRQESLLHKIDKELVYDYNYLAPSGCLQYFTEPSGIITSFGFNYDSVTMIGDPYVSNQHYSICFKRYENKCGIIATIVYAQLRATNGETNCSPTNHYLQISGRAGFICANDGTPTTGPIENFPIIASPPGPIHIDFHAESNQNSVGFNINYELVASCGDVYK
ncbi:uncharacterized protein [Onthophagus taurus]|uniref:uncharacterized protein n=1 Tax=Onthophagus taurus TaxID=166361 RepID=UPI0039BDC85A